MNTASAIGSRALAVRQSVSQRFNAMSPRGRGTARFAAFALAIAMTSLVASEPAYAQANLESFAQKVVDLLSSALLRSVAIIALIAAGFGWLTGRVNTGALVTVLIGIAIIFSAPWIVTQIAG